MLFQETRDMLTGRYNEAHRHYHDIYHILDSLAEAQQAVALLSLDEFSLEERDQLGLMIWFHDAVYRVGKDVLHGRNEAASADLFRITSEAAHIGVDGTWNVVHGILASARHTEYLSHPTQSQMLFLDIDLCGMGKSYGLFEANGRAIRKEYEWATDAEFLGGRTKFFNAILAKPFIYYHHLMRGQYEKQTRANIKQWLAENKDV